MSDDPQWMDLDEFLAEQEALTAAGFELTAGFGKAVRDA